MKEKLNQFVANLNGQFVEVSDKSNVYQCMDLAYTWVFCLGFPKATIQRLRAYEVFANPTEITRQYFDLITNTPEAIPQDGDLVVWSSGFGPAGHIGIALGGGTVNSFMVFEQNSPLGTNAHLQSRSYSKVLGWLRPKLQNVDELVQLREKVGLLEGSLADTTRLWEEDKKAKERLTGQLNELQGKYDGEVKAKEDWEKFFNSLWDTLAPIGKEKNPQNALGEISELITKEDQLETNVKYETKYNNLFGELAKTVRYTGRDEIALLEALQKAVASAPPPSVPTEMPSGPGNGEEMAKTRRNFLQWVVEWFKVIWRKLGGG